MPRYRCRRRSAPRRPSRSARRARRARGRSPRRAQGSAAGSQWSVRRIVPSAMRASPRECVGAAWVAARRGGGGHGSLLARSLIARRHGSLRSGAWRRCVPATGWTEVGDRVFVRRYRFYDQDIVAVLGGGDEALVVDTRSSPAQAREILDDLAELRAGPVGVVVNTHGHYDHVFGNAQFRPAPIWGHERCRAMIETTGQQQLAAVRARAPEAGRRARRGRARPAGPALRRRARRSTSAAARSGSGTSAAATRTTTSWSRSPTRTSCARATCSRTARRRTSATATRSTGRRPWSGCSR